MLILARCDKHQLGGNLWHFSRLFFPPLLPVTACSVPLCYSSVAPRSIPSRERQTTLNLLTSQAAAIQTDEALGKLISDGLTVIEAQKKYGFTDEAMEAMRRAYIGGAVFNRIKTALEVQKDSALAQRILDSYGEQIDAPTRAKLQAQIADAAQYITYEHMWDTDLSLLVLEDGTPDEEAIDAKLEDTYGLKGEQLIKARSYMGQMAAAASSALNAKRNATWNTFVDAVDAVVLNGGSKEQALKVWRGTQFPRDHDRLEAKFYIENLFKPAAPAGTTEEEDLGVWSGLYVAILNGSCTLSDLQSAARQHQISQSEYKSLFKMLIDSGSTKKNEERKRVSDYITDLAKAKFPGDTAAQHEFTAFFQYTTKDMSLIEATAYIQNSKDTWKSHFETTEKLGKQAAEIYGLFGAVRGNAIIDGLRQEYGPEVTIDELIEFKSSIGGYTNENQNAIINLYRLKIPITSATIKALISIYPSGIVPKAGPSAEFWEAMIRATGR